MIQCEYIHHVSIVVTDLERAKRFYQEVLGLQEIKRPDFDFAGAWFAIGSQQLHLIVHSSSQTLRTEGGIDTRDGHFAVRISNFEQAIDHLEAAGIAYKANRVTKTGWPQIFCCDPDGNIVELNAGSV
ncbi:MAG: glyoxalase [Bacilli bacterium]|nr:glyoxalase [Bacilli bacterium]